jgi:ribosomal protein L11 methyltransferase
VIRLAVRVRREHAELVLAELLDLAPAGVEEASAGADEVEYAVYGAPGELPALPDLRAAAGEALVQISTSEIADDWPERWRDFHQPVIIEAPRVSPAADVGAIGIRPPWLAAHAWERGVLHEIVIDPGQAFGTGSHATTRLCLELLLELAARDSRRGAALDIGTGSGVLGIAAAKLSYAPVLALDHERESVAAARANAAANDVDLDVRRYDLREGGAEMARGAEAPMVVLANLIAPLLETLATTLAPAPAHLIAGGLLHAQVDEVADAFARALGLRERARRARGEWSALWLERA